MSRIESFELPIEPFVQSPRKVWVYLPDSYDHTKKKYDVLYMFDGHNLFLDELATYGKSWGIKDYLDKTKADLVVIGQDCSHHGEDRMSEYCPYLAEPILWNGEKMTARGDITARWFVEVLKPYCEQHYRIYRSRNHVGIAGSSMGGLMSMYFITAYNKVFSKAACVSPSVYFCEEQMRELIEKTAFAENTRIYLDMGSEEVAGKQDLVLYLGRLLEFAAMYEIEGCHTFPHLVKDGRHCEASWETIVPLFLKYLYPELF
ncbi:MAG: alpha/beta hydrolase [Solobacterium sp.]|nr:alpha/beta hydrolase [Solobacterium sp.]